MAEEAINQSDKFKVKNLQQMSFPKKLWICANLEHLPFLQWGCNGKSLIILDMDKLGVYLKSEESLFKENNSNEFLKRLLDHDFYNVPNENPKWLEFRNNYFGRDQQDYFYLIVDKKVPNELDKKPVDRQLKMELKARQRNDKCFQSPGVFSDMGMNQMSINVDLEYEKAINLLNESLKKKTLPADRFKNAYESHTLLVKHGGYHNAPNYKLALFNGETMPQKHGGIGSTPNYSKSMEDKDNMKPNEEADYQDNMPSTSNNAMAAKKNESNNIQVESDDDEIMPDQISGITEDEENEEAKMI